MPCDDVLVGRRPLRLLSLGLSAEMRCDFDEQAASIEEEVEEKPRKSKKKKRKAEVEGEGDEVEAGTERPLSKVASPPYQDAIMPSSSPSLRCRPSTFFLY